LRDFLLYFFKIEFFILYSFFIHYSLWFIALIVFVPVLLFLKILFNHYFHPKLTFKVLLVNVLPVSMRLLDPLDLTFAPHFFINTSLFTLTTILFPRLKTLTAKLLSHGLHSHHLKNLIGYFFLDYSDLRLYHFSRFTTFPFFNIPSISISLFNITFSLVL